MDPKDLKKLAKQKQKDKPKDLVATKSSATSTFLGDLYQNKDIITRNIHDNIVRPAIFNLIDTIVSNGIKAILWPDGGAPVSGSAKRPSEMVSWRDYSGASSKAAKSQPIARTYEYQNYEYEFATIRKTEIDIKDIAQRHGKVRVADFYSAFNKNLPDNVTKIRYDNTAYNWGWYDVSMVKPVPGTNGFWKLNMPPAVPIEDGGPR